jgi:hypothetical protein
MVWGEGWCERRPGVCLFRVGHDKVPFVRYGLGDYASIGTNISLAWCCLPPSSAPPGLAGICM